MTISKSGFFLLLSLLFLSFSLLSLAYHDTSAELDLCVKRCHEDEGGLLECTTRCEREDLEPTTNREDPRRLYELCQKRCDRQEREGTRREQCRQTCRREFERRRRGEHNPREEEEEEGGYERSESNPYHFESRRFRSWFRSREGSCRVLPKFTQRSKRLFKGIENYRITLLEAEPHTFIQPHHSDAVFVFVVVEGRGTVTFVTQNTKESFNIEQGHVVRVPAGTTVYYTNTDENERLRLAKIYIPVNIPGRFEEFFLAGDENQQSYFRGFSTEVLEATLNTPREQLERVLGQPQRQREGIIRRVSPEQIRELSRHASSPRGQKQKGQRWGIFNLHSQRPRYSNRFGQFYEANPEDFDQLEDLDLSASCLNLTQGSIFAPHYNSRATVIVFVVQGNARFEMACPHISSEEWQQQRGRRGEAEGEQAEQEHTGKIHKIRSEVSEGDVFIIPAGHPVAVVAHDSNFVTVGFAVNAKNSQRNFLAGQENMINQVERQAKQLTFGVKGEEVERVFKSAEESYFMPLRRRSRSQPGEEEERSRRLSFQSILGAAAGF